MIAGQLEQEIADNAWLVAPAPDTILFETIYEDRYPAANQLLGINPHNFVFHKWGTVNGHPQQSRLKHGCIAKYGQVRTFDFGKM